MADGVGVHVPDEALFVGAEGVLVDVFDDCFVSLLIDAGVVVVGVGVAVDGVVGVDVVGVMLCCFFFCCCRFFFCLSFNLRALLASNEV